MGKRIIDEDEKGNTKSSKAARFLVRTKELKTNSLIVVLENASLENIKVGGSFQLLNIERHKHILNKKQYSNISNLRPDIVHQCLLMLMDSPLNLSGHLHIYIHTQKNVLIQINPKTRIPRTFDRFCGLMVQLLENLTIQAATSTGEKLLRIVKNPVTDHFPLHSRKFGTSCHATLKLTPQAFISTIIDPPPKAKNSEHGAPVALEDGKSLGSSFVFVVGAMAHGQAKVDYTEEEVCLSDYPLSAALTCAKICDMFEQAWNIF